MYLFIYQISTQDFCIKSLDRMILKLLYYCSVNYLSFFGLSLNRNIHVYFFMLICVDNISNCEEIFITDVSAIPKKMRIKIAMVIK